MPIQRGKVKHKEIKIWLQRFFFWRLGKALSSTFVVHTSLNNYFTFGSHLFRCALLLEAPSFFSHLGPHGLHQSLTLSWIREYDHAFTPLAPTSIFSKTIVYL
jgi:hypothetical protein